MGSQSFNQKNKEAWRDFLLQEVVAYLQSNKEGIMARYLDGEQPRFTREEIEQFQLMDFDVPSHCTVISSLLSVWELVFSRRILFVKFC